VSSPTGPFDETQVAQLQSELGTSLDFDDLAARYDRLDQDLDAVITEVLRIRLADINAGPTSFAIPGEYQQDASAQQRALQARLGLTDGMAAAVVRIAPSEFTELADRALDTEERTVRRASWRFRGRGR
jgi:hypothetical protein